MIVFPEWYVCENGDVVKGSGKQLQVGDFLPAAANYRWDVAQMANQSKLQFSQNGKLVPIVILSKT